MLRLSQSIDQFLIKSRESRLELQSKQTKLNFFQRFFGWGVIGWISRTAIQSIPSEFFGYGIGDLVTGISALRGRDFLDGERLDTIDKIMYTIATVIPFVPATILVSPMRKIRMYIEDSYYRYKQKMI